MVAMPALRQLTIMRKWRLGDMGERIKISVRTASLRALKMPLEKMICYAACDLLEAESRPEFAETYGGVDEFKQELRSLINIWASR